MKPIQIKVSDTDLESWKRVATEEGLGLSEWIRGCCNSDVQAADEYTAELAKKKNAHRDTQPVREPEPVHLAERSTSVSSGDSGSVRESTYHPDVEVARRTGHPVGCGCFQCVQCRRQFKSAIKKEEKKAERKR